MYIVVDKIVAILQVLSFGYAVGRYQHIYLFCNIRIQGRPFFGYGRKQRQYLVEIALFAHFQRCAGVHISRNKNRMQSMPVQNKRGKVVIQIKSRIGECGKYDNLFIRTVDRMRKFSSPIGYKLL